MDYLVVDQELCTGCGVCIDVCPTEAIVMEDDKARIIPDECTSCQACVSECPVDAIS